MKKSFKTAIAGAFTVVLLISAVLLYESPKGQDFMTRMAWRQLCNKLNYDEKYQPVYEEGAPQPERALESYFDAGDYIGQAEKEEFSDTALWQVKVLYSDDSMAEIKLIAEETFVVKYKNKYMKIQEKGLAEELTLK